MSGYFRRMVAMRFSAAVAAPFLIAIILSLVDVSVQQQAKFVEEPQNVTIKEGETALLRCILSQEVRDCSWQRDGATFAMGGRYNYAPETSDGRSTSNCSIVIAGFNRQLDGVAWQCVILGGSDSRTQISSSAFLIALEVESGSIGIVLIVIIAVVVFIVIVLLLVLFMYRRKSWVFAPKPIPSSTDKDAEAANGGEADKPDEKTALSQESQYDNVNGKEDEINGKKPVESPFKNDQNANKQQQPTEVVYAQLDLVNTSPKKPTTTTAVSSSSPSPTTTPPPLPTSPQYEKTEYAEIRFNNKENQV